MLTTIIHSHPREPMYEVAKEATYDPDIIRFPPHKGEEDTIKLASLKNLTAKLPVIDCEVRS